MALRLFVVGSAGFAIFVSAAQAQEFPASASFAQLSGEDGCLVWQPDSSDGECGLARALNGPVALAVAPEQRQVYVASAGGVDGSNSVTVFSRDQGSGALDFSSCVSETGGDGRVGTDGFCADGDALLGASDLAFSPDGRFLYVTAAGSHGVSWFVRDADTGALTPAGCAKAFPRGDRCTWAAALEGADGVAVSPDGRHLYVTAFVSGAVTVFARNDVSGSLDEVMCVSDTGSDGHCVDGTGLRGATSVVVAADGRDVYVTAEGVGAVTSYRRDAASGRLEAADCLVDGAPASGSCRTAPALAGASDAVLTPDGQQLLVASQNDSALAVFARDTTTGGLTADTCYRHVAPQGDDVLGDGGNGDEEDEEDEGDEDAEDADADECRPAKALFNATRVAVSPDGRGVFVSSPGDYLAAFERNPASGALRQFGCAEERRTYRSCSQARNMRSAHALAVSGDARNLYVATNDGVSVFAATTAIASRTAAVRRDGTIRVRLACPVARARACSGRLKVVQPRRGGRARHFSVRHGRVDTVTLRLSPRLQRTARRHRRVHVTVLARDAQHRTRPAQRRLLLRQR
jgi:6-phosphogluconolactonase (cycloisomerase 2 family)